MFEVGTIVSVISTDQPFKGIVVPNGFDPPVHINADLKTPPYPWDDLPGVSMVLITSSGEYQGKVYPFQKHQLEIISESS